MNKVFSGLFLFAASRVQIHFCILSFSFQILFVYFPQRSNYFFWYLVDLAVHTSTYKPNPFILLIGLNLWINTQTISSALQFWKYIKQTSIHERIFVLHMIFIISIWIDKLRAHFARTSFEFWSKAIQWEKLEVQMLTSWKRSILIKTLFWHVSKDFMLIFWKMSSCYCSKIWLEHFELCPKCEKRALFLWMDLSDSRSAFMTKGTDRQHIWVLHRATRFEIVRQHHNRHWYHEKVEFSSKNRKLFRFTWNLTRLLKNWNKVVFRNCIWFVANTKFIARIGVFWN